MVEKPNVPSLRVGGAGSAVADLQQRLETLGFSTADDPAGTFGTATDRALRLFQTQARIDSDGMCGPVTWAVLVESGHVLGERLLYLRAPMMRGDDIAELQSRLGALGFDPGRVDGIFGQATSSAVAEFQRNSALAPDGICGPDTLAALERLGARTSALAVAHIRDDELRRNRQPSLIDLKIGLTDPGGCHAPVAVLAHRLRDLGAIVVVLEHSDGSLQAREANLLGVDVVIGLRLATDGRRDVAFFQTQGFESRGGKLLAEHLLCEFRERLGLEMTTSGKRVPLLRETRMPAILIEFGPPVFVVHHGVPLANCVVAAVNAWLQPPQT